MRSDSARTTAVDVVGLSRPVVAALAPDELALFDATSAAYLARRAKHGGESADELLGFGVDTAETVITVVVLAGSQGAVAALLERGGSGLVTRVRGWRDKLRRRRGKAVHAAVLPLTPDQLDAARTAAVTVITAYGLPERRARVIANAIVGELALQTGEARDREP